MQLHDERIGPAGLEIDRVEEQSFDRCPVVAHPLDLFLPRQRELALETVVQLRDPDGSRFPTGRHQVDLAEPRRLVELHHDRPRRAGDVESGRNVMSAVGQLGESSGAGVNLKHFAVHAHVDGGIDRSAVGCPRRLVDRIFEVGQQRTTAAAGGRNDEQVRVVVRLELRAGLGEKQHFGVVGRDLGSRLFDLIVGEAAGAAAVRVDHPDFAARRVVGQRRGSAVIDDASAVAGHAKAGDGPVAGRDLRLRPGRHGNLPEVPLLERRLVERVHVVAELIALAFLGGARVRRGEIDGRPVGGPRRRNRCADAGRVMREVARLAAVHCQQLELAVAPEDDRAAVGRPASGSRRLAVLAERELLRVAADRLPPQVPYRTSQLPVGVAAHVCQRAAVGRQLRIEQPRQLGEVEQRHRALAGRDGLEGQDGREGLDRHGELECRNGDDEQKYRNTRPLDLSHPTNALLRCSPPIRPSRPSCPSRPFIVPSSVSRPSCHRPVPSPG